MKNAIVFAVLVAVVLAGCATIKVHSDYHDPQEDFSALKTYKWVSSPGGNKLVSDELDLFARDQIDSALQGKGYQRITSGTPDFGVDYHVTIEKKEEKLNIAQPYTPIDMGRGGVQVNRTFQSYQRLQGLDTIKYEEGTLIIDMTDPASGNLIWRGSASAVVNRGAGLEKRKSRGREAIDKILANFPPQ